MITFLPCPSFRESILCLDYQRSKNRLSNQLTESCIMLETLINPSLKQDNHPAFLMWKGYEHALLLYAQTCVSVWEERHSSVSRFGSILKGLGNNSKIIKESEGVQPFWINNPALYASHRSILLAKDYLYYSQFNWAEKPAVKDERGKWPYFWPVQVKSDKKKVTFIFDDTGLDEKFQALKESMPLRIDEIFERQAHLMNRDIYEREYLQIPELPPELCPCGRGCILVNGSVCAQCDDENKNDKERNFLPYPL